MLHAQADVPSAGWPRAQLAFKYSMVHGILQFALRIAFRCALHRCESQDIRCRESYNPKRRTIALRATAPARAPVCAFPLARNCACSGLIQPSPYPPRQGGGGAKTGRLFRDSNCHHFVHEFAKSLPSHRFGLDNDPSAGSPTETLLRLLLPLNDKVQ